MKIMFVFKYANLTHTNELCHGIWQKYQAIHWGATRPYWATAIILTVLMSMLTFGLWLKILLIRMDGWQKISASKSNGENT